MMAMKGFSAIAEEELFVINGGMVAQGAGGVSPGAVQRAAAGKVSNPISDDIKKNGNNYVSFACALASGNYVAAAAIVVATLIGNKDN